MENYTVCQLQRDMRYEGFLLIRSAEKRKDSKGNDYVDMNLTDRTGEINCKIWNWDPDAEAPEAGQPVKVRGTVQEYNGRLQLRVEKWRTATAGDPVDMNALVPCAPLSPEEMTREIRETLESFTNEDLLEMLLGGARQGVIRMPSGRTVGGGMLDAYGAFTYKSGGDPDEIRFSTDYTGDYRFKSHESVTLDWTIIGNEKARLQVSVDSDCPGLTSDCSANQVRMKINALQADPGDYLATIRVGDTASQDVPFTILENHAPTRIARFGDQIINVASNAPLSFNLDDFFSDPDGERRVQDAPGQMLLEGFP